MPGSIPGSAVLEARERDLGPGTLRGSWGRFRANRTALAAAAVLGLLMGVAWGFPVWAGRDPNALSELQFSPPSLAHWMGTDANGRDVFLRVCVGARVSLVVGLAAAGVSLVIGVVWGAVAGFLGGRVDGFLMRTVDLLYALPSILFVIVLMSVMREPVEAWLVGWFGPSGRDAAGQVFLILGLGAVSWLTMARMVRAEVMALKNRSFVEAAVVLGAGPVRILFHHLLPHASGVILVYLMLTIPAVVLGESFLSFLGLGIQPPGASLGSLIAEGSGQINPLRTQLWLLLGPGSVLVTLLLSLGFVGDGLRDALNPRGQPGTV